MSNSRITKWKLVFPLGAVLAIGGACFFIGGLSSRTTTLEDVVDKHSTSITELTSRTLELNKQVLYHYEIITNDVATLKSDVANLKEQMGTVQSNIAGLRKNIRILLDMLIS